MFGGFLKSALAQRIFVSRFNHRLKWRWNLRTPSPAFGNPSDY
jgi:hypothetical protein